MGEGACSLANTTDQLPASLQQHGFLAAFEELVSRQASLNTSELKAGGVRLISDLATTLRLSSESVAEVLAIVNKTDAALLAASDAVMKTAAYFDGRLNDTLNSTGATATSLNATAAALNSTRAMLNASAASTASDLANVTTQVASAMTDALSLNASVEIIRANETAARALVQDVTVRVAAIREGSEDSIISMEGFAEAAITLLMFSPVFLLLVYARNHPNSPVAMLPCIRSIARD